jgi:hypothetical protein
MLPTSKTTAWAPLSAPNSSEPDRPCAVVAGRRAPSGNGPARTCGKATRSNSSTRVSETSTKTSASRCAECPADTEGCRDSACDLGALPNDSSMTAAGLTRPGGRGTRWDGVEAAAGPSATDAGPAVQQEVTQGSVFVVVGAVVIGGRPADVDRRDSDSRRRRRLLDDGAKRRHTIWLIP